MNTTETDTRAGLRRAMMNMPYSGNIAPPGSTTGHLTDAAVTDWLHDLATVLNAVTDRHDKEHAELVELRRQRNALRDLLGTSERKDH